MDDENKPGYIPNLEHDDLFSGKPVDEGYFVPQTALPVVEQRGPKALENLSGNGRGVDPTQPSPEDLERMAGNGDKEPSYGKRCDTVPQGPQPWFEQNYPGVLAEVSGERNLEFYANRAEANIAFLQDKKYGFNTKFIRKMLFEGTRHALRIIETPEFMDDPVNGIRFTPKQLDTIYEDRIQIAEAVIELIDDLDHLKIDIDHFLGVNADNE